LSHVVPIFLSTTLEVGKPTLIPEKNRIKAPGGPVTWTASLRLQRKDLILETVALRVLSCYGKAASSPPEDYGGLDESF